jgi:chemotaxis protein MotB
MAEKARPIIILKKKGGHGGHHGGAWKVAYADFVTAMMAFFMVLWLVGSAPKPVKEAIAGYFNDPSRRQPQHRQRRYAQAQGANRRSHEKNA